MSERRVALECGHTRTLDNPALRAECWVCLTTEAVVSDLGDGR